MSLSSERPQLVADIGGTNARFALFEQGSLRDERVLTCADYPAIGAAITDYLESTAGPHVMRAALAVACPITGDQVALTNNERWSFSIEATRRALGFEQLIVLNDFTALALSLPSLKVQERRQVGSGSAVAEAPIGLIGPGTGLGVSGLVWSGEHWIPLQTEGGHVTFSPVGEREWEITRLLYRRLGHVSAERLLSGPGLVNIHRSLLELDSQSIQELEPEDITTQALTGECKYCQETLEIFCAALGTAASNLALTLGARGGIYIGGGIVPRLGDFFEHSSFRPRFEAKGRFVSYLAIIPTWVITASHPALRGAAAALAQPD